MPVRISSQLSQHNTFFCKLPDPGLIISGSRLPRVRGGGTPRVTFWSSRLPTSRYDRWPILHHPPLPLPLFLLAFFLWVVPGEKKKKKERFFYGEVRRFLRLIGTVAGKLRSEAMSTFRSMIIRFDDFFFSFLFFLLPLLRPGAGLGTRRLRFRIGKYAGEEGGEWTFVLIFGSHSFSPVLDLLGWLASGWLLLWSGIVFVMHESLGMLILDKNGIGKLFWSIFSWWCPSLSSILFVN